MLEKLVKTLTPASGDDDGDHRPTSLELKTASLVELGAAETACVRGLHADEKTFAARSDIVRDGDEYGATYIACTGWAYRYKDLEDGRRQILSYVLPGDIIGIYAALSPVATGGVATVTAFTAAAVKPQAILDVFADHPRLGALLCWNAAQDDALLREQVVRVGRRSAYERTAHLLLELLKRLQRVEQATDDGYRFPVTQEMLADTLGLTVVHVNRVLRRLRENGLIERDGKQMTIVDTAGLIDAAQFEPNYLEIDPMPALTRAKLATKEILS